MEELEKGYNPANIEKKWYSFWKEKGFFIPSGKGDPFVIVIPPPNITGILHMGHALNLSIQDFLTRYNRMRGRDTLWLPGEDHAGIATQNVIEKKLKSEGTDKEEVGREKFLEITWEWAAEYRKRIASQIEVIGCSVDWSRERFTLDEGLNKAVNKVFNDLYKKGLIYKGKYLINWCPRCQTVLSDEEVEHNEEKSSLWYIKYPVKGTDQFVLIATTRPETMLGDTAVAAYPGDERYSPLKGKTLILPIVGREIHIIEDRYVDPSFGTGAVKVTPAHDPNDYQMGVRHNLEMIEVIDQFGIMNETAGKYKDLPFMEARKRIVEELDSLGFLEKIEDHTHAVGHCYRCDSKIDPRLSDQWFVQMKPLAEKAIAAAETGKVEFIPERWKKVFLNWLNEIRDWCISRQLWWGHRIPVWYCEECGEINVAEETPLACSKCGSKKLHQDEDVLDTWFSSALWPFSTLGWPEETMDLKKYYPTSTLVTAFDIIFFWVARMIIMGEEFMGEVPFGKVVITQLIRDKTGKKMSKSLGNGVDPIEVVRDYGADSMRFCLAMLAAQGKDINLDVKIFEIYRHFSNKIWNASRFALMNLGDPEKADFLCRVSREIDPELLTLSDRWILSRLNKAVEEVSGNMDKFEFNQAAKAIYGFFWNEFCDWYIESLKPAFREDYNKEKSDNSKRVLIHILDSSLRLLHPFMPFITEEIWQKLPVRNEGEYLINATWPEKKQEYVDEDTEKEFGFLMEFVRGVRNIKAELKIPPSKKLELKFRLKNEISFLEDEEFKSYLLFLTNSENIFVTDKKPDKSAAAYIDPDIELYAVIGDIINWEEEKARLEKELTKAREDVVHFERKLENKRFVDNALPEVVEETTEKMEISKINLKKISELLNNF